MRTDNVWERIDSLEEDSKRHDAMIQDLRDRNSKLEQLLEAVLGDHRPQPHDQWQAQQETAKRAMDEKAHIVSGDAYLYGPKYR